MRYVYLFCLVVLLLPAQGTELVAFKCFLVVPRLCREALDMAAYYGRKS